MNEIIVTDSQTGLNYRAAMRLLNPTLYDLCKKTGTSVGVASAPYVAQSEHEVGRVEDATIGYRPLPMKPQRVEHPFVPRKLGEY